MGKEAAATKATGLILELAKKEATKGKPRPPDDYRDCAKGILAAIKSGNEDALAQALKAMHDVSRAGDDA